MKRVNYDQSLLDDRLMDLSFPGQRTTTATSCIPHDSVYMPGPRAGKSDQTWPQLFQNDS